ncbi:MAG: MFS transporter [Bacteroidales bacterium]|nr:MFS transporter [Bacteroidales bacterium]
MSRLRTWSWVLSANFSEGLPYTIVNTVLIALLADMGVSNGPAAMIPSLLALPWMWKFLWSPFIDTHSTKRRWMLLTQAIMAVVFFLIALSLQQSWWLPVVVGGSALAALASATYDVSCDGYYMLALPPKDQAFFVGIRSTAYRLGMLFASGVLLILAKEGTPSAWQRTFYIIAALMLLLAVCHKFLLPKVTKDAASHPQQTTEQRSIREVLKSFVQLHAGKELLFMLLFIFTYRLGEAFLSKVTILFLKDGIGQGGMGLNNEQYGYLYGTFGTLSLVIGGILGGICVSRWGLKRCIIPMVLALDLPDLLYVWLSYGALSAEIPSLAVIGSCISIEQFGYGFGFTAYMIYLLECAKGPYETSHYAFLTALMAFGLLIPSTLSGYIQEALHSYYSYFAMACLLTVPGILMSIWYVKRASHSAPQSR